MSRGSLSKIGPVLSMIRSGALIASRAAFSTSLKRQSVARPVQEIAPLISPPNIGATKFKYIDEIPGKIKREAYEVALEVAKKGATLPLSQEEGLEAVKYLHDLILADNGDLSHGAQLFSSGEISGIVIDDVAKLLAADQCQDISVANDGSIKTDSKILNLDLVYNKVKAELPNQFFLSALLYPLALAPKEIATPIYVLASREEGVTPQFPHVDVLVGDGDKGSAVDVIALTAISSREHNLGSGYGVSTYAISVAEILKYFSPEEIDFLTKKIFVEDGFFYESSHKKLQAKQFSILQPNGRGGYAMSWDGNGRITISDSADCKEGREVLAKISWAAAHLIARDMAEVIELRDNVMVFRNYNKEGKGHVLHGRIETQPMLGEGGRSFYSDHPNVLFAQDDIRGADKRQVTRYAYKAQELPKAAIVEEPKALGLRNSAQTKLQIR